MGIVIFIPLFVQMVLTDCKVMTPDQRSFVNTETLERIPIVLFAIEIETETLEIQLFGIVEMSRDLTMSCVSFQ